MKTRMLKPGSIIIWKEYNTLKRFWYKLIRKELKYNKCIVIKSPIELLSIAPKYKVFEPKKQYSKKEIDILTKELPLSEYLPLLPIDQLSVIINLVRSETINASTFTLEDLFNSKYYKESNA